MEPQNTNRHGDDHGESLRRTVHDVAAAVISIRALAEILAEHVPILIAVSRSRGVGRDLNVPMEMLDALPALPREILNLCEVASNSLKSLRQDMGAWEGASESLPKSRPTPFVVHQGTDGNGPKILLVEDEETVRYVLAETLREQGCAVTSASDGDEALELFKGDAFDMVLMDLRIPGMSGWDTAKILRQAGRCEGRQIPIIGLTASPLIEDQQSARAAGMDEVIVKPVDEDELKSVLERYT